MQLLSGVSLRPKTTMRIGGNAKYFAELSTRPDVEDAVLFASQHRIPLLPLGSGSNTVFADGEINALVVRLKHEAVSVEGNCVTVGAGKNLAMLINELALQGLDLSPLTGIPGTVGGAIFGNAGQGPKGVWINMFVESVTVFDGKWKTMKREECGFGYRESGFKKSQTQPIIWEAVLKIPSGDPVSIKNNIESLLKKRIETQPHLKTAGSCFKAVGDTPAWQLIDRAGLRGFKIGGVEISSKHANFLMNTGEAKYGDAVEIVEKVRKEIPQSLEVEMRFIEPDGSIRY